MNIKEVTEKLASLDGWSLEGKTITKVINFSNFKESLNFVNKIGEVAEKAQHHPDIVINYDVVKITLITHSEKQVTEKDFELAKSIDEIK